MKSVPLRTIAALVTVGTVTADTTSVRSLNRTDALSPTRRLLSEATFQMVGAAIIGKDIGGALTKTSSAKECLNHCVRIANNPLVPCTGVTWTSREGGLCLPKAAAYKGTPTTPRADAESFVVLRDSTSSFIWSETKDGFDMADNDIDNKRGGSMRNCIDLCNANTRCFAVTWTNYQDGTCWLKSRASGYVAKAGARTAYVARKL